MGTFIQNGSSFVLWHSHRSLVMKLLVFNITGISFFFFTYDSTLQRVRSLLGPDSPLHLRWSNRLVRNIQQHIVTWTSMTWILILDVSPTPGIVHDFPFVSWLTRFIGWWSFRPQIYQQSQFDILLPCSSPVLSSAKWIQLWSLKFTSDVISLCFRFLYVSYAVKKLCPTLILMFCPFADCIQRCTMLEISRQTIKILFLRCRFIIILWTN